MLGGLRVNKILFSISVLLTSVLVNANAGPRVGDFSLLDQDGYFHHMAWYDDHKAIAFLVQVNGSAATRAALAQYSQLQGEFTADGFEFMMINPLGQSRESVQEEVAALSSTIPVLIDDAQIVAEAMQIDKAGEALLFDPRSFEVIYRGTVSGLEIALEQTNAGVAINNAEVTVQGEAIHYPAKTLHASTGISYSKEIAPILAENCATCHRDGGIAPFAMDSHAIVQGWSPMIREVLMTKRMPPGQIDPHVGNFSNDYVLDVQDQQKLVHWIEAGAPRDGDTDPLAQLVWPETKWALGEPDLIVKVPPQNIPATGVLDYITVEVPIELDKDRWVRASQYIPGDRTVLHHTLNELVPPGATGRRGFLGGGDPNQANITAYIPGAEPAIEPPNTGGLLKAGSTLRLQLHYTTTGKETVDASEIGVWFYPEDEIPSERMSGQCACIFPMGWTNIPPFDPDFELSKSVTLQQDVYMQSFLPHMHFRGKRMRFTAYYPDGREQELINIANYNYNWQISYKLEEPIFMPAGTKIVAVGAYDNSTQNKSNPDPERSVPWGDQSWDEMFFGAMSWKNVEQ